MDNEILAPHGVVRVERPSDAERVRALDKERRRWQDAAMSGGLPARLPKTINADTLEHWMRENKGRVDVLNLLEGGPKDRTGPLYGGKYVAASMVGWAKAFDDIILPTFIEERIFHNVVWYVLTDDTETWEQVESHCVLPRGDLDNPDFGLDLVNPDLLKGIVSPALLMSDTDLDVEHHGQNPILGTWYCDDQEMEALMGVGTDRPLSGWLLEGEIATPLMPKYIDEWRRERVESGVLDKDFAEQFEVEHFTLDEEDFLNLVVEHQKACHRFGHALWAVNWINSFEAEQTESLQDRVKKGVTLTEGKQA